MSRKFFCINLQERPDRRQSAMNEIDKLGIRHVIFPKFKKHPRGGLYGCRDSHYRVWTHPSISDNDTVIVFEDDIEYIGDNPEEFWDTLSEAEELLNKGECEIVSLNPRSAYHIEDVSERFCRARTLCTLAYISKGKYLKSLPQRMYGIDHHVDVFFYFYTSMIVSRKRLFDQDLQDTDNEWGKGLFKYFLNTKLFRKLLEDDTTVTTRFPFFRVFMALSLLGNKFTPKNLFTYDTPNDVKCCG